MQNSSVYEDKALLLSHVYDSFKLLHNKFCLKSISDSAKMVAPTTFWRNNSEIFMSFKISGRRDYTTNDFI